jgi:hypothetical protein
VSKYYKTQLVKGLLLFLALGGTYFLVILALEYFFWLGSKARLLLLIALCLGALYLAYRFIMVPLFYLLRVRKGLSNKDASKLIGKHFSQIDDKLLNLLDLADNTNMSELLVASIDQKSKSLELIPFVSAINFKDNLRYTKYLGLPLLLLLLVWLSGSVSSFFGSYERVLNYDLAYEPPAPFSFQLLNDKLTVLDTENLVIQATTQGDIRPENMYISSNGELLLMQKGNGVFKYTFEAPVPDISFNLIANNYRSRVYHMKSLTTPSLQDFSMRLQFPSHTQRIPEIIKGTGNVIVPEGTKIEWNLTGKNIDVLNWSTKDTTHSFSKFNKAFKYQKRLYSTTQYAISSSNDNVMDFETLHYEISVVRDANPTVKIEQFVDSTAANQLYFRGQVADDYKVSEFRVVVHPIGKPDSFERILLEKPNSNVAQVYYTFPSGFTLTSGQDYVIYFEAVDNDVIHGGKVTKSQAFATRILNKVELKDNELSFQDAVLDKFERSFQKQKEQQEELDRINATQKQKNGLNFENIAQIKQFLKKQEKQENLMEKFAKQLKETLNNGLSDEDKQLLKERLERQEEKAKKNAELLEELNKIADKIDREELKKKLEELGKSQSSSKRNLEQLLELTKRYYVTEKAAHLAKKLDKLAEEQEILSEFKEVNDSSKEQQKQLNERFDTIDKELDELKKDNKALKKPLDLNIEKKAQSGIQKDQEDALEEMKKQEGKEESSDSELKEPNKNSAAQKQKSAAQKMRELGDKMGQSTMSGGGSSITEDAEMLRQILDNLITFSFKQEGLFESLQNVDVEVSDVSSIVKKQKELRDLFEHVDDSLFALSLRRAELSEFVNEQITEVYYNVDKSLESVAQNQIYQGASYQQYVLNGSNNLADFLAKLLDNLQQSMQSGQGQGQGGGDFQLPDIIQGQGELQQQMGQSGKKGKEGKEGEGGEQGNTGKNSKENNSGNKEGKKGGQKGNEGKQGKQGGKGEGGGTGNGVGEMSESELQEVFEIYKQQQILRQELEKQLSDMINEKDRHLTKKLICQMEDFENDLLENGITQKTINKVNQIQHQLLKLENASLQQGEKQDRESNTNSNTLNVPITTMPELIKNEVNEVEILNRQALPLRQNYQSRVKEYFKHDD